MIDIKKLKIDDVLIGNNCKKKRTVKYISPDMKYIVVESENGSILVIQADYLKNYTKRKKYIWTDWEECMLYFNDPFDWYCNRVIRIKCKVRSNGKRVQVRSGALSAMASCNEDCGDKFNFDKGVELAGKRLILKWLSNRLEAEVRG
jgi:hypothetical protein